jgi:class 3 adenylate cyclase
MPETTIASPARPAHLKLEPYTAELRLASLNIGVDNIHYDVYLSPRFLEVARQYLSELVRYNANLQQFFALDTRQSRPPELSQFRKLLSELLQSGITRAQFEKNIELDVLLRLALIKFLTQEVVSAFSSLVVECKEFIRTRGPAFEHSEQAHLRRAQIAELQANRKSIFRRTGQMLFNLLKEMDDTVLGKSRRALFGEDFIEIYDLLTNRLLFVENGNDDYLFLEQYVLLGNFLNDPDRFEVFDAVLIDFLRDYVITEANTDDLRRAQEAHGKLVEQALSKRSELARLEEEKEEVLRRVGGDSVLSGLFKRKGGGEVEANLAVLRRREEDIEMKLAELGPELEAAKQKVDFLTEEYRNRLGDYLSEPQNARKLFDPSLSDGEAGSSAEIRERLLEEWHHRLLERELVGYVLASYEIRNLHRDYCPPVHLQQLRRALLSREELKRVEKILSQFPARNLSLKRIEEASKSLKRCAHEDSRSTALRFAEDLMRLRRDRRNYQHVTAWTDKINLIHSDRQRELSRVNNSLYEFVFPEEQRSGDDPVVTHTVIKADVRGSTEITKDLLSRGLNPASHFSLTLHEPVKRLLQRHGAAKVFIEGDAIILAIYETESTRASQRGVAKACVLAREILDVTQAYNEKAKSSNLPPLELGVGLAFQNSAPSVWSDGESRIMISKALNLSDRLSSCSKMARRLIGKNPSPFNIFILQTLVVEGAGQEEGDELLMRYNMNGIELNEEGFAKLTSEISLFPLEGQFPMPWGKDRAQLFYGELPLGDTLEPIVIRRGMVRELLPGGKIGNPTNRPFFEVCVHPKLLELARKKVAAAKR